MSYVQKDKKLKKKPKETFRRNSRMKNQKKAKEKKDL